MEINKDLLNDDLLDLEDDEDVGEEQSGSDVDDELDEMIEEIADEDGVLKKYLVSIRYQKSFMAKLIQSDDKVKNYYKGFCDKLLGYKTVKSRISWNYDSITSGKNKLIKFTIRGKSLYVYFNLLPQDYIDTKYLVEETTSKKYLDVPCLYKIKNPRRYKYALELIDTLINNFELKELTVAKKVETPILPYESTKSLLEKELIKEVIKKKLYKAPRRKKTNVKEEKIEVVEVVEEITPTPVIQVMKPEWVVYCRRYEKVVNLDSISKLSSDGDVIDLEWMKKNNLVNQHDWFVKVLARGRFNKKLIIRACDFSKNAISIIEKMGGKVIYDDK